MNKHLDFDTEFLNDTVLPKTGSSQHSAKKKQGKSWNWWKIVGIAYGVFLLCAVIAVALFSDDSGTTTSQSNQTSNASLSSSVEDDTVNVGTYRCSRTNHDRAKQLQPQSSELDTLEFTERDLSRQSAMLDAKKTELENAYVDEYSQISVDLHNEEVDAWNRKVKTWKNKVKENSNAIDAYNSRVDSYNTFLSDNCTPR